MPFDSDDASEADASDIKAETPATLVEQPFEMTFGLRNAQTKWTDRRSLTFSELAEMLSESPVGQKDGPCYCPATFSGTNRFQHEAEEISIAVLDSDIGYTLAEIVDALEARDWRAIVHSTHSHLSTETDIAAASCDKWMREHPGRSVGGYMEAKRGYLSRVTQHAEVVGEVEIEGKPYYRIRHAPCPKFRILVPLLRPWFAADYDSRPAAIDAWKAGVAALAATLRLSTDQSCCDTSRLFYLPRSREGVEFLHAELAGERCDLFTLPAIQAGAVDVAGDLLTTPVERVHQDAEPVTLDDGTKFDMRRWAGKYAARFEIATALKARKKDVFGDRVKGPKLHIICPCSEDHVTDQKDKTGTFVVDASNIANASMPQKTTGFIVHCSHNGCHGRDRLDFLGAMLRKGWLQPVDLTDPAYLVPEPGADIDPILARVRAESAKSKKQAEEERETSWPDPVDFIADETLTGVPELRPDHAPPSLWPFVSDVATRLCVDPTSVLLSALAACAEVITDDWKVQPKQHDHTWTQSARLWVAMIGDPSAKKSPVIGECTKPIGRLEDACRDQHADAMRAHEIAKKKWKAAGANPETEPREPRLDRYLIEGATMEALRETLRTDAKAKQNAPAKKIFIRHDELSEWAASMDQYRNGSNGSADRGAYLRLWNGGDYNVDRVNHGPIRIKNWSAGMLGGIQPDAIKKIAQDTVSDGLLQRFLFVVAREPGADPDQEPAKGVLENYNRLFGALQTSLPPASLNGQCQVVKLHADAHQHREGINVLIRATAALPDTPARTKAALDKWGNYYARLCLTYHLIEIASARLAGLDPGPLTVLSEDTARRVADLMREVLLPHLLHAYEIMFSTVGAKHARWIAFWIISRETLPEVVTQREIVRDYRASSKPEHRRELQEVMASLVAMGWLFPKQDDHPSKPPTRWDVNPNLSQFATRGQQERERRKAAQAAMSELIRANRR